MGHRWIRRASPHAVWLVRPPLPALFVSVTFPSSPPISIRAHLFPSPLPSPHLQSLLSPSLSVPPQPLIAYHPLRPASSDLASQTIRNKNQRTAMSHPALVLLGLVVTGALVLSVRHAALVIASHGGQSSTSGQSEGEAKSGTGGAAGGTSRPRVFTVQVRKYEAVVPRVALVALAVVLAGAVAAGVRH
ncbi:unnamed protein product [Closterium sp. NIES-65]|nr:unnamed protein product [Closterium sp. NIES-65]